MIVDIGMQYIFCFDSMHGQNNEIINWIWYYLCMEAKERGVSTLDKCQWRYCTGEMCNFPRQLNGDDCGVMVCMAAKYFIEKSNFSMMNDKTEILAARQFILKKRVMNDCEDDSTDDLDLPPVQFPPKKSLSKKKLYERPIECEQKCIILPQCIDNEGNSHRTLFSFQNFSLSVTDVTNFLSEKKLLMSSKVSTNFF